MYKKIVNGYSLTFIDFADKDINDLNDLNQRNCCALCGRKLKGGGIKVYTDLDSISISQKPYVDEYGDSIQGHADIIIGSGCALKYGIR